MEGYNLSKPTQEERDNLNSFISMKETESIINYLLKQKAPSPDGFPGEFYQIFKKEIIPILYNLL